MIFDLFIYVLLNGHLSNVGAQEVLPEVPVIPYTIEVEKKDDRIEKLSKFFRSYNSELAGESATFIEVSDEYSIDWRILPSIAMVESSGGKHTPSCAEFNSFGWSSRTSPCGFYRFTSYKESIEHVAEKIGTGRTYIAFQTTGEVSDLAKKYNPGEAIDWTKKVKFFIKKLNI